MNDFRYYFVHPDAETSHVTAGDLSSVYAVIRWSRRCKKPYMIRTKEGNTIVPASTNIPDEYTFLNGAEWTEVSSERANKVCKVWGNSYQFVERRPCT